MAKGSPPLDICNARGSWRKISVPCSKSFLYVYVYLIYASNGALGTFCELLWKLSLPRLLLIQFFSFSWHELFAGGVVLIRVSYIQTVVGIIASGVGGSDNDKSAVDNYILYDLPPGYTIKKTEGHVCACVCTYTHTRVHTLTSTSKRSYIFVAIDCAIKNS